MGRPAQFDLGWIHYPANDLLPEHFSCPFAIIIQGDDGKWEAFATTAMYSKVSSPEHLGIAHSLGKGSRPGYLRDVVGRELARVRRKREKLAA